MSKSNIRSGHSYRDQIVGSLTPVRPLPPPSRRAWMLVPVGLLIAITGPMLNGERGDLGCTPRSSRGG